MNFGPLEITLILLVLILLFGAKRLPELARGTGRALRIFKAETKGLMDDDTTTTPETRSAIEEPRPVTPPTYVQDPAPQTNTQANTQPNTQPGSEQR